MKYGVLAMFFKHIDEYSKQGAYRPPAYPKLHKQGVYSWRDYFRPRWVVLDQHDNGLWFKTFWTKSGALKAFEACPPDRLKDFGGTKASGKTNGLESTLKRVKTGV